MASAPRAGKAKTLLQLLAVVGPHGKKAGNLPIEEVDIGWKRSPRGRVTCYRAGTDRQYARISEVARSLDRLEFRVEQVLGAAHDQRLRFDRAQRLDRVAVHARRRADIVPVVGP